MAHFTLASSEYYTITNATVLYYHKSSSRGWCIAAFFDSGAKLGPSFSTLCVHFSLRFCAAALLGSVTTYTQKSSGRGVGENWACFIAGEHKIVRFGTQACLWFIRRKVWVHIFLCGWFSDTSLFFKLRFSTVCSSSKWFWTLFTGGRACAHGWTRCVNPAQLLIRGFSKLSLWSRATQAANRPARETRLWRLERHDFGDFICRIKCLWPVRQSPPLWSVMYEGDLTCAIIVPPGLTNSWGMYTTQHKIMRVSLKSSFVMGGLNNCLWKTIKHESAKN